MDGIRQQLFIDYMYYLNETDRFYATKARYAKHVLGFLESARSVDRRGFMAFKREHSLEMANDYSCGTAICDFLNFCGKGYNRKKKSKVKTLEKLCVVSDKNKEQLNGFMAWIDENFDYSPHTLNMYYYSLKKFFEYANEVNISNAKMYVSTLEEQALSPQTIRLRILGDDFTKGEHSTYSKIIANPPFSHNQDIDHVRMMYEFLKEGGTLAAITSKHWEFSNEKKCEDFRAWISSVNGEVFNIPQGEFNCSGTPIETRAIIIRKNVL